MKKHQLSLIIAALLIGFQAIQGCKETKKCKEPMKAKSYSVEEFFKNPEQTAYRISPDGKYYSYLAPYERRLNIFVMERGSKDAKRLTAETDRDISSYFWASSTRILYLQDNGGDENYKLYGVNTDGTDLRCYTDFEKVVTQIIDDLPDKDDEVIIGLNKRDATIFDPYRLNLNTGEMTMLAENPGNIQGWVFDHDAKLRVATTIDGTNTTILYRETEQSEWKPIITTNFKESVSPAFFTFDNKNLYAVSNLGRDKSAAVEFDLSTGKEIKVLYENPEYDVDGIYFSQKRKVLTAASYLSWKRERHFFDEETNKLFQRVEKELAGYEIGVSGSNKAEDVYILRTYSDRSLGAYYIYDKTTDKIEKIVEVSPWLDENEMSQCFPVQYTARDGVVIHGYLTLPKGYSMECAKNLPVVVNPHGGPWHRDAWGYNPEIQFMANRGYAVFQMNFRGSTGYGRKFWENSFRKWGREMQDDITDGTKWLISQGIADPARIAIYGGSYGGYATLMGLVREPDLYAAGIDYVGVSNMFTFLKTIPPYWKPFLDMMYEMVGNPTTDSLMFREVSPVYNAEKIKKPLFIAQGANDPRVNKDESDQMVSAMKARGIEVEYMVKDNEGHGFGNEENQFDFYRTMETFLGKHLAKK